MATFEVAENCSFRKRYKTADFQNETSQVLLVIVKIQVVQVKVFWV